MALPGFTAGRGTTVPSTHRSRHAEGPVPGSLPVKLAQSQVFCGVCALGGFGCGSVCHSCGPFGWFECCDSVCTEPVTHARHAPLTTLSR